ncbi:hypothetical protein Bca4012_011234 [Brassica carinata]|uniref:Uncharacterized protein n=1 Tax=Brassica carinata TaxID=52824 RepID=A0A8X7V3E8_BRACI|nr:hypothetical protein Bca52824_036143 [Brassica carinata]
MLQITPTVRIITSHEPQLAIDWGFRGDKSFFPKLEWFLRLTGMSLKTQELTSLFVLRLSQLVELFTADYVFGSLMGGQKVLLLLSGVV